MDKYIVSFDSGTSSVRTLIINKKGEILTIKQKTIDLITDNPGCAVQDPEQIWNFQLETFKEALKELNISTEKLAAIGIANQRETIIAWNKTTGKPIYNAIIWQDIRTEEYCQSLIDKGLIDFFKKKTGLIINPYFSATKIHWILENVPEAKQLLKEDNLLVGTVDTWICWKSTNGKTFSTDVTNASRTLLFNIHTLKWDAEILDFFNIPESILPKVYESSDFFGEFESKLLDKNDDAKNIPITSLIGDQQSSLFASYCFEEGSIKNTYGTGCFTLINTGTIPVESKHQLLTTIAWKIKNQPTIYALEGSVFSASSTLDWIKNTLGLFSACSELDSIMQKKLIDNEHLFFIPAFTGLGAPYWDGNARAALLGIDKNTNKEQIIKSAIDSIAFQTNDLLTAISSDLNKKISSLRVDGGLSNIDYLMKKQSDISQINVERLNNSEATGIGAAYMAGLSIGYWKNLDELKKFKSVINVFTPKISDQESEKMNKNWKTAVNKTLNWKKAMK